MARLDEQDKMVTAGMGGVLAEQEDPTSLRRVLDVGCGTGGWLLETAKHYPRIERLVGADISSKMMEYAREKAKAQSLEGRVAFQTMDALRVLEFPDAYFDLVNQRFGVSWVRTWDWKKLLLEYQRVTRPGGIIRMTEASVSYESSSPALTRLNELLQETFYRSGRLFTDSPEGLTGELVGLLRVHGITDVKSRVHAIVHHAGTPSGQGLYEDIARLFRVSLPFMQKWIKIPGDYEEIYQQALREMQEPGFVARGYPLTVWGIRSYGPVPLMRGLM
jgi:SAM-dependent methyltransferase